NSTTTITVATDASGVASAPFTANGIAGGPYTVTATAGALSTGLSLTNTPSGAASLSGQLSSKNRAPKAPVWALEVDHGGPGTANNAQIDSFVLQQTGGAACTPVVSTPFPLGIGNIGPGSLALGNVTIDFTGCVAIARFTVTINFSANGGAATGTILRNNEFR